jgi:hypothetical protein
VQVAWEFGAEKPVSSGDLFKEHPQGQFHAYRVRFEDFESTDERSFRVITTLGEPKAVWLASNRLRETDPNFSVHVVVVSDLGEWTEQLEVNDLTDRMEW